MEKYNSKISLILSIIILISTFFMSIGYAAINNITSEISGTVRAVPQSGVFIYDVTYVSNNGANVSSSKINSYYRTVLDSKMVLGNSSTSTITYTISIYNNSAQTYAYAGTTYDSDFYDNENITFALNGLSLNDTISAGQTKTFNITFSYADGNTTNNTLNSWINFQFKNNYTISYNDVTVSDGVQTNIAEGLTYTNTFTPAPGDISVTMGGTSLTKDTDYTYANGTLSIPNVTGNLVITGVTVNNYDVVLASTADTTVTFDLSGMTYDELIEQVFTFTNNTGKNITRIDVRLIAMTKKTGNSTGSQYVYPRVDYTSSTGAATTKKSNGIALYGSTSDPAEQNKTTYMAISNPGIPNGSTFEYVCEERTHNSIVEVTSLVSMELTFTYSS